MNDVHRPDMVCHRPHPQSPEWCGFCDYKWPCSTGDQMAELAKWLRQQAAERRPIDENEVNIQLGIEIAADMVEGTYLS